MTDEEFVLKYRPLLLHYLADCWAVRKEAPSAIGLLMDVQMQSLNVLLYQMFKDLRPQETPAPTVKPLVNGSTPTRKVITS